MPDPLKPVVLRLLQPRALVVPAFGCLMFGLVVTLSDKVFTPRLFFTLPVLADFILQLVLIARARPELGPDGIRNRTFLAETFIPWWDIKDVVITSGSSYRLQVVRASYQRPVILAAARDDLDHLAALIADQAGLVKRVNPEELAELVELTALTPPHKVPGWSTAPLTLRPSRRPLAAPRDGLLGRDLGFNGALKRLRAATPGWVQTRVAADNSIWSQSLGLYMTLERRPPSGNSGTAQAQAQADMRHNTSRSTWAAGGMWLRTTGDHEVEVQLRRANVVITVDYEASNHSNYAAQAEALAHTVAAKIKLG